MGKFVSIIVPVYNVAAYLDECVQSLTVQSYRDLEIILVDDASPDNCGAICDRWAAQDSRVRVIHKKNSGAASARNAGLDVATGDYVCFVDGDDTVEADYVQTQLDALGSGDMTMCGFFFRSRHGSEAEIVAPGRYDKEGFMLLFLKDWRCSSVCNKLFRRSAIGDLRMDEGHKIDDEFFTYQVALNCQQVVVIEKCLYHYRLRASSVMQDMAAVQERVMLDRIAYNVARYAKVSAKLPQLDDAYFLHTLDTLARYWHHSKDMPAAQKQLRRWINKHFGRLLRANMTLKQKLAYLLAFYFRKPAVTAEANPIQTDPGAYFD